jgi:hypothetical protein
MRVAYADPPYPGQAKRHYAGHPDYAGEVDHVALIYRLVSEYDGYCLHTSSVALADVLGRFQIEVGSADMPRVMAWVKPFAAFKRNVSVAYAWEPIFVKACRKPKVSERLTLRDWIAEPMTLKRGLVGAKPERICWWLFEVMGMESGDELIDLFPGSGAVSRAWEAWRSQTRLAI